MGGGILFDSLLYFESKRSDGARLERLLKADGPYSCGGVPPVLPSAAEMRSMSYEGPSDPGALCAGTAVLPSCPYRGPEKDGLFPCAAGDGQPVMPTDCRSCPIPEAVAYKKACLYLIPIRHEGRVVFFCNCYSNKTTLLAAKDWRRLCFCNFWFPRGPADRELAKRFTEARHQYRPLLAGEARKLPGSVSYPEPPETPHSNNRFIRWLRWQRHWWFKD